MLLVFGSVYTGTDVVYAEGEEETADDETTKEELASAVLTEKQNAKVIGSAGSYINVGATGVFDIDRSDSKHITEDDLLTLTRVTWFSNDTTVLTVDSSTGSYRGIKAGRTTVYVTGYADYKYTSATGAVTYEEEKLFGYSINISVLPSMTAAAIDRVEAEIYISAAGMAYGSDGAGFAEFVISGTGDYVFDSTSAPEAISVKASTKNFSYKVQDNVLTVFCSKAGENTVTASFGDKTFTITLHVTKLKQKGSSSLLLVKGKSSTLKLYSVSEAGGTAKKIDPSQITWKASNSRVSVSASGKVKAKKLGATCIRGTYQGYTYYWVVNVCTAKKAKVIAAGQEIAKGIYSQPRRMSAGYYDCSSLVWRAYQPYGYNFGTNYTAPVAASEAKYLYDRGKMIAGAIGKTNVQKLKLRPGDLLFEGGEANGRWGGIYHVEMFKGYGISSIDSSGKPIYMNTWVNRVDGCYGYGTSNDYVGRP